MPRRAGRLSLSRPAAVPYAPQVATIYDVAVHPAVRGHGVGLRLLKLLVQQLQSRGVYDIGLVAPPPAHAFFRECCFEDDREGSTFMTLLGHGGGRGVPDPPRIRTPQQLLADSCWGHWETVAASQSLRDVLGRVLLRGAGAEQQDDEEAEAEDEEAAATAAAGPRPMAAMLLQMGEPQHARVQAARPLRQQAGGDEAEGHRGAARPSAATPALGLGQQQPLGKASDAAQRGASGNGEHDYDI